MKLRVFRFYSILLLVVCGWVFAAGKQPVPVEPERVQTDTVNEMRFEYYYWEAVRQIVMGDYETAIRLFQFCDLLRPGDPEVSRVLGIYHYNGGRREMALVLLETAYRKAPENAWYEYSTALLKDETKKSQKKGLQVLEEAARRFPEKTEILEVLQAVYLNDMRLKDYLRVQDRLDELVGYNMYSAERRFQVHMALKQPKAAMADLKRYLDDDPSNLQIWLRYMQVAEYMQYDLKKLEPIYLSVLRLDPHNATVLNNYAYALVNDKSFAHLTPMERNDRLQHAEIMVRRALMQENENLSFLDTYAWVLYLQGNREPAQRFMRFVLDNYKNQKLPKEVQRHAKAIFP